MRRSFLFLLISIPIWMLSAPSAELELPLKQKSVRFAVIGDTGTGGRPQYEIGEQMTRHREKFPFQFVLMLGDNLYGGESPADFKSKFDGPYRTLLDGGVKFYAALGNHDNPNQRFYKPFNMSEKRYYNFKNGNAEFFALDSTYMDPQQLDWIKQRLEQSRAAWKICYFHHPLYSDGRFHGSDIDLRERLEPIFIQYGVRVVLSGHDHVYERFKPQKGIFYFVVGNSGQLRLGNLRRSDAMAKGFDTDQAFMMVEIAGDQFFFQTISRTGKTVDSGVLEPSQ